MSDPVMRDLDRYLDAIDAADRRAYAIEEIAGELARDAERGWWTDKVIEWDCANHERTFYDAVVEIITRHRLPDWQGKAPITEITEAWATLCRQWAEYQAPRIYEENDE